MDTTNEISKSSQHASAYPWTDSLWFRILLIGAIALGIFFRLAGLGNKIYSHDEAYASLYATGYSVEEVDAGLWDEKARSVKDIQKYIQPGEDKEITDTLSFLAFNSPHQAPLFYLLAHFWMRIVGYTPAAMRGLAALFGLLSIPAMYWFSRELFQSPATTLISTVLFALSPFYILFSQDARPYSLWTLATLLSSAALLRAMRKSDGTGWLIYSITLIVGTYSHQLFILMILVHGCYFIGMVFMHQRKGYGGFLSALLLAFLACAPWLYLVIAYWDRVAGQVLVLSTQTPWNHYIQFWTLNLSSPLIDMDFYSSNLIPYLLRGLVLILIVAALLFLFKTSSKPPRVFIFLIYIITAGALVIPDLLFGGMRSITGRYFVPVNIATILVVAHFLANRLDQAGFTTRTNRGFLTGLLVTIAIISNINSLLAETWWNKKLSRVIPEFVNEIDKDQTLVIVNGLYPTNFGDVLALSLEVESDVHFKLYVNPKEIEFGGNYQSIYWIASSPQKVHEISERQELQIREVIPGSLWQIGGTEK